MHDLHGPIVLVFVAVLILLLQPKFAKKPDGIWLSVGPERLLLQYNAHLTSSGVEVTRTVFDPAPLL